MSETRTVAGKTAQSDHIVTIDGVECIESTNTNKVMSEDYREPGMERIRDWVFEKQEL